MIRLIAFTGFVFSLLICSGQTINLNPNPARDACLLGLWLHGKAGDLAADKLGYEALLAGDIIKNLGKAYKKLY